ncbi:MAG TPA: TIGR01777 family oxidoreductase [Acidothermaceae bacterium]
MRILVSGSSGLVGSALTRVSRGEGDEVLRLVRRPRKADDEVPWDPSSDTAPDLAAIDGVDAVVHLGGAGIGDHRWTESYRREIRDSRVRSTALLATALARLDRPPHTFLSGSAVGYYGDGGDAELDENSPAGKDFLAGIARDWEAAAAPATDAGIRTVWLRSGIVLSTRGGALAKVLPLFRAGLGVRLGGGRQYISWIARPDHVSALRFLLKADDVSGAVNITAPNPVTNAEYTREIAAAVRRPAWFAAPAPALRVALGRFAETVVTGQRVLPARLLEAGFTFAYPRLDTALRALFDSQS